jgi:hypothetical protein
MTAMQTIAIQVTPEAAQAFNKASAAERKKLELLLSLRLLEVSRGRQPLEKLMREVSRSAQARGLTEKKLNNILKED